MPHTAVGLWGQVEMGREICRVCPARQKTRGTSLHLPSMGGHLSRAGDTRSWGKPTPAAAPAKLSKRRAAPIPQARRREPGGGRGAAGGTARGSCPRPPGVGQT